MIGGASTSGVFQLVLFDDGGMTLYQDEPIKGGPAGGGQEFQVWDGFQQNINDNCPHAYLAMQTDGNLVRYCRAGDPLWSTHTAGTGSHNHFQIQNDGNLAVYTSAGKRVWASHSAAAAMLTGQHLNPGQRLRTQSANHPFVSLTMQTGGDLVLTYGARLAWHSGTHTPGSSLQLLPGGNLIVQGPHGHTLWSTHTAGIGVGTTLAVYDEGEIAEVLLDGDHGTSWSRSG